MEAKEILIALAKGLRIRTETLRKQYTNPEGYVYYQVRNFVYRDVSEGLKNNFANILFSYLSRMIIAHEVGDRFELKWNCNFSVGGKMAEILADLPPLNDGEEYSFPKDTHISMLVSSKKDEEFELIIEYVSPWIKNQY